MPGSIRVSVLESVDLPPEATGGKHVSIKVSIGKREFQTSPSEVNGGKTAAWNSNFAFPVLNLQENLMVALLDSKGNAISQIEIGTPIIVEKGSLEELFSLKGGGCVHLRLSFVLTLEERMRIEAMREAALQKKYKSVNKNATTQVLNSAEENRTGALVSGTVISQNILRDVISKDESYNEKNQITTIIVPQVSLPYDKQKKTETTERASLAPISSPIENVIHKEISSHDLKDISDQHLEENGCQHLPVIELEEAAATVSSKELTPPIKDSSLLSDNMSFPKYEIKEVVQENTVLANENIMLAQLPPVKDRFAELENSEVHDFTDKFSVIGPGQIEFEKNDTTPTIADMVVSETPFSQGSFTSQVEQETYAPGPPLCQENRTLSIASSGSFRLPDSSDSHAFVNLDTQFHGGTPHMPSESNSLSGFDGTANVLSVVTSSEEGIATSSLSTFPNVLPLHSSRDGSISLSALVDSPGNAKEEKTIPFPNIFPKSTQLDQTFQLHQSIHSTEIPHTSTAYDVTIADKEIIAASHPDSDFCADGLCTDQTSAIVINTENTELFAQNICLARSNTIDSPYKVSQSDTGNGSLSGKETEGVCEALSLQAVPCQSSSTEKGLTRSVSSNVPQLTDNKVHIFVPTSFPKPLASRTVNGDGRQSSVKAKIKVFESTFSSHNKKGVNQSGVKEKIKVFESSLSQDPDCHTNSSLKTNHKIEAERARQRLREEAASAEAAEARRRAEEDEAKMKSAVEGREGNKDLQQRKEELQFTKPAKLKRKDLERNKERDKREPQKDVKNITNSEEDIRTQTFREEEEGALMKYLKEKGKNLSRKIESKETMTEDDCRQRAVNWEAMRLGELQLKRDFQGTIMKPDLSAKENEMVEKSLMDESTKVSWSSKASEQKWDVGIQAGESQLIKPKAGRSAMEARVTSNEKEEKGQNSNHDHVIEPTVHSMTPGRSFAEDMSAEKDPTISNEKLEDLVNGSTAFGGFIKQALSAAALLAAGALLMWLRGETMNERRRSRMAQPNNQHYFLADEEATSRNLQGEFGEPNLRIPDFSPEVTKIKEMQQFGGIGNFRLEKSRKKLHINTKGDIIKSRIHLLNEEEQQLENIAQRERKQLQTLVHTFCKIVQRAQQDIVLDNDKMCRLIDTQRNLEISLKNTELQLQHIHLDNCDKLEEEKMMFVAPTPDMMKQMRNDSSCTKKLHMSIKELREKCLETLNYVKEIEGRRGMVREEVDILLGATKGDPNKILYSPYIFMPYLKRQNGRPITSSNLNKRCCVCLSNLEHDGFYGLQCNHLYHFSCLLIYIIGQNKCAACKDVISYDTYLNLGIQDFIPKEPILDAGS